MINDDIIIKWERSRGHKYDWPTVVNHFKSRLQEMKMGFPGIGDDHLSIVRFDNIQKGEIFIFDPYIETDFRGDLAPIMFRCISIDSNMEGLYRIEGIGRGFDLTRDPNRLEYRWGDEKYISKLAPDDFPMLRVDVRPTLNGGPGYYYFFKSYRDFRY